jgi:hypothetical protein
MKGSAILIQQPLRVKDLPALHVMNVLPVGFIPMNSIVMFWRERELPPTNINKTNKNK